MESVAFQIRSGQPLIIRAMRILLAEDKRSLGEWLAKRFELAELEARLTALVWRARSSKPPRLACGPLHFDTLTRQQAMESV